MRYNEIEVNSGDSLKVTAFCYTAGGTIVIKGGCMGVSKEMRKYGLFHYQMLYHRGAGHTEKRWDLSLYRTDKYPHIILGYWQQSKSPALSPMVPVQNRHCPMKFQYGGHWHNRVNTILTSDRPKWHLIVCKDNADNNYEVIRTWRKLPQTFLKELSDLI